MEHLIPQLCWLDEGGVWREGCSGRSRVTQKEALGASSCSRTCHGRQGGCGAGFCCYFFVAVLSHCTFGFLFPHVQYSVSNQWFSGNLYETPEVQKGALGASVGCVREPAFRGVRAPPTHDLEWLPHLLPVAVCQGNCQS